jgi:uncharacterized protein YndB with AHSA1/START domain
MEVVVERMEAERRFAFHWHPYPANPEVDYSKEPPTLVEFTLEKAGDGTVLTVTESGFDALPDARRDEAYRMDDGGWTQQMKNIEVYVTSNP